MWLTANSLSVFLWPCPWNFEVQVLTEVLQGNLHLVLHAFIHACSRDKVQHQHNLYMPQWLSSTNSCTSLRLKSPHETGTMPQQTLWELKQTSAVGNVPQSFLLIHAFYYLCWRPPSSSFHKNRTLHTNISCCRMKGRTSQGLSASRASQTTQFLYLPLLISSLRYQLNEKDNEHQLPSVTETAPTWICSWRKYRTWGLWHRVTSTYATSSSKEVIFSYKQIQSTKQQTLTHSLGTSISIHLHKRIH